MAKQQNPYHFFNTYCIRTPLQSLNFYKKKFNDNEISFDELKKIWHDNVIKEAIFIASPELFVQLQSYFQIDINNTNRNERLEQAFLKYIIRLSTRCAPFGLFAGVSAGTFSRNTKIELKPISQFKRITRFDTNYIVSLLNHLSKKQIIKNQLLFYPNSTLYSIADQCRYIEFQLNNNRRSYSLEGFENNNYLKKVLFEAERGKTIKELAGLLLEKDISIDNASDYISLLIENQILVSELELSVTGKEILAHIIERMGEFYNVKDTIFSLKSLHKNLLKLDEKFGNATDRYQKVLDDIQGIDASFNEKHLFQTDLFIKTHSNELAAKHVYTVKKLIPLFNKLTPFEINRNLELFKKAFFHRYETREVSLTKVLDVESGIGYIQNSSISDTVPFLQDIIPQNEISFDKNIKWTQIDEYIHKKLLKSKKEKKYSIAISDKDFEEIDYDWNNTPDTLAAFVEIVKINKEEHLVVNGLSANAGNIIARFSHGDENLLNLITDITSVEQKMNPNKVLAEIVHMPEASAGNILKRPHLRQYEIPYLAKSTLKKSQQLPIEDLLISIQNGTIILRSKRLDKEVFPKLTNAHNYENKALPIYQFLCDMQYQNKKRYFGYSWPSLLEQHSFLPRITYKNVIISKAKWYLNKKELNSFIKYYNDKKPLLDIIENWRKILKVPKYVQLIEGDNTLLIDLENITSIRLFLNIIKNKSKCEFEEFLFSEDAIVKRNKERFTNEFVFAFYNREKLNTTD